MTLVLGLVIIFYAAWFCFRHPKKTFENKDTTEKAFIIISGVWTLSVLTTIGGAIAYCIDGSYEAGTIMEALMYIMLGISAVFGIFMMVWCLKSSRK